MLKLLRKHNKKLLAVFMALLMVVFLGGGALDALLRGHGGGQVVATSDLGNITAADIHWANNCTDLLGSMGQDWQRPAGNLAVPPLELVDWVLLVREAERCGFRPHHAALVASMQQGGAWPLVEEVAHQLRIRTDTVVQAWEELSAIQQAARKVGSTARPSEAIIRTAARDAYETVETRIAVLPADAFREAEGESALEEAELRTQFETYREQAPGGGALFGYYLPDAVRVEYIKVDRAKIEANLRISSETLERDARRFYEQERETHRLFRRLPARPPKPVIQPISSSTGVTPVSPPAPADTASDEKTAPTEASPPAAVPAPAQEPDSPTSDVARDNADPAAVPAGSSPEPAAPQGEAPAPSGTDTPEQQVEATPPADAAPSASAPAPAPPSSATPAVPPTGEPAIPPAVVPPTLEPTPQEPADSALPPYLEWEEAHEAAINWVRTNRAKEAAERIANWLRTQFDDPWAGLDRGPDGYKTAPEGVTQPGYYAQQVAALPRSIAYEDAVSVGMTDFFTQKNYRAVPEFGLARLGGAPGVVPQFLDRLAFNVQGLVEIPRTGGTGTYLSLYQTAPQVLQDGKGGFFVWRVVAVKPAHPAESLDEVRAEVEADVRLKHAFERANAHAERLLAAAAEVSDLQAAFDADETIQGLKAAKEGEPPRGANLVLLNPRPFSRLPEGVARLGHTYQAEVQISGITGPVPRELVEGIFALGQAARPFGVFEHRPRAEVLVVQYLKTNPAREDQVATFRESAADKVFAQRASAAQAEWLNPEKIRARHAFKLAER
ncbi:MAG TPA: hypothetical protein PKK06_13525 [Phycisphaerae bacterium]|nr:hypothetical protein [Phycisphaerae bacterium]HNU46106.1 hypothetical protein [Phycisphaerae bacterium]